MKTAKQIAIDAAKKAAREPVEIVKTAGRQIAGAETVPSQPQAGVPTPEAISAEAKKKTVTRDMRIIHALETEAEEIRKKRETEEKEAKLQEEQQQLAIASEPKETLQVQPKKGRRLAGWGQKLKQLVTKSETRQPPSG